MMVVPSARPAKRVRAGSGGKSRVAAMASPMGRGLPGAQIEAEGLVSAGSPRPDLSRVTNGGAIIDHERSLPHRSPQRTTLQDHRMPTRAQAASFTGASGLDLWH